MQENISAWLKSSGPDNRLLWLRGTVDAEISAVMQAIAKGCTETQELAATFFFSREMSSSDFWPTIAFQLAMLRQDLQQVIGSAVEANTGIFCESVGAQLQKLIIEPFLALEIPFPVDSQRLPVLVIFDALHACQSTTEQSQLLLSIVHVTTRSPLPLRFVVASRPEPQICALLDGQICHQLSLEQSPASLSDTHMFLRGWRASIAGPWIIPLLVAELSAVLVLWLTLSLDRAVMLLLPPFLGCLLYIKGQYSVSTYPEGDSEVITE